MAKVTAPNVGGQVRPKEPPGVKAKRIFKSFVKTNGYVVATTSLNYCGAIIADKLTEGAVSALFGKDWAKDYNMSLYYVLFFAAVLLLFGICFECKVLIISFIFPYALVIHMEEEKRASYMVLKYIFSVYAGIVLTLLLTFGVRKIFKSKLPNTLRGGVQQTPKWWHRVLEFFCCGSCQKIKQYRQVAQNV
ncbi:uncharacterized protein LOC119770765 [Culex quinquefasciatus]|uniref:uncharacterized protein LOC119770765 n=1 Tax=Culex quinquefasciatus TaxID=7176 RepID=UPI0018E38DC0|nr:uncharacterized protein LOC119770765 [Culex quinquefasciatus]